MSKYDDFDLDLKQDKVNRDGIESRGLTDNIACSPISLTCKYCETPSKPTDCYTGPRSTCSPCGSGYAGVARC